MAVTGILKEDGGTGAVVLNVDETLLMNDNKVSSISARTNGDLEALKKDIENNINGTSALTKSDFTKQIDDLMKGVMLFVG